MTNYADAGVDISEGDKASKIAYQTAKNTFSSRKGMIGEPVIQDGGFAGVIDMGDFYLVQNDDGIGTKSIIAESIGKYDTLGVDLLAMVIDDASCVGAEVITCSNTMDVKKVVSEKVKMLMEGFGNACREHKVVIPGGEIAELNTMVNHDLWNATSVGVVDKKKIITGEKIKIGDQIIALRSDGFRSNGFSLVRHILKNNLGDNAYLESYPDGGTWGEAVLTPSKIYYSFIMELYGRLKEEAKVDLHGVVHVTGGGIPGNITRILSDEQGAQLNNLFAPRKPMLLLQEMGGVSDIDAYHTWNMGVGMFLIVDKNDVDLVLEMAIESNIEAQIAGQVTDSKKVELISKGFNQGNELLVF